MTVNFRPALFSEAKRNNFINTFGEKNKMPTTACPECSEDVYVDAESEQGDIISCDECGSDLEIVGLDPIELDIHDESGKDDADDEDEFEY